MSCMFIDDGYTFDFTFPAKGRLPALGIKYRPALPAAAAEYRLQFNRANDGKGRVDAESKLIADHVVGWDAKDKTGTPVPCTHEWLAKVPEGRRSEILEEIMWGMEKVRAEEKN